MKSASKKFYETKILNLTQHDATPSQIEAGVFEPVNKDEIKTLLTFEENPNRVERFEAAKKLVAIAIKEFKNAAPPFEKDLELDEPPKVMIGGAPWFMSILEKTLLGEGFLPVYSFSKRRSFEETIEGKVVKRTVFEHTGWVE